MNWLPKICRMRVAYFKRSENHIGSRTSKQPSYEHNVYVVVWKGNPRDCAIQKAELFHDTYERFYYTAWYNPIDLKAWWHSKKIFV